jgi:hypothetical protein
LVYIYIVIILNNYNLYKRSSRIEAYIKVSK